MKESVLFELALTFFIVANPIGNSPAMVALVKGFDFQRQKIILFREAVFALIIALFFQYLGEVFLNMLHIDRYAVTIAGGLLLCYVAIGMLFHDDHAEEKIVKLKTEPFIVPIATPLISGPGLLAIIMFNSSMYHNNLEISLAILIAFTGVIAVLTTAPYLQKYLGTRGLAAMEQIMGMILLLISFQMLVTGGLDFLNTIPGKAA